MGRTIMNQCHWNMSRASNYFVREAWADQFLFLPLNFDFQYAGDSFGSFVPPHCLKATK